MILTETYCIDNSDDRLHRIVVLNIQCSIDCPPSPPFPSQLLAYKN